MSCSPIQPNLWVGPDPRDDKDFENLHSLNITAILSLYSIVFSNENLKGFITALEGVSLLL
jgi:hypothetical protein